LAEIHLACPGKRNAISNTMHAELIRAFLALRDIPGLRAAVFAAQGKVFCAGGDFELILEDRAHPHKRQALAENARQLYKAVTELPVPIVAALQGDAVGLGATLALGCDAIVACRTARISDPHVVIGLAAGDGGCVLWPQLAGLLRAKRYLLSGDRLSAVDAHAMGLVTDLVDTADAVYPAALALAQRIAALPPLAVQATKRALNHGARLRAAEVFDIALELEIDTLFSKDVGEAIAAIRERRPGQFEGR
jgi:enoyl-CoA hydratase